MYEENDRKRRKITNRKGKRIYNWVLWLYFMLEIPSTINILSQIKVCTDDKLLEGYTQESYTSMLSDKIKLLEELKWEFIDSLYAK